MTGQKRARRGDGTVSYDPQRKRWLAVIELPPDPDTGKRVRRKLTAPTKTAAAALLNDMRAEKKRAGTVGRGDVTVAQVVADYMDRAPHPRWRSPLTWQVNRATPPGSPAPSATSGWRS